MVRVPASLGWELSFTVRSVDNGQSYVALAVLLEVSLHGIENKIKAPAPIRKYLCIVQKNVSSWNPTDLPSTLPECLESLTDRRRSGGFALE